jgi:hypothetical protein
MKGEKWAERYIKNETWAKVCQKSKTDGKSKKRA